MFFMIIFALEFVKDYDTEHSYRRLQLPVN